MACWFLGKSLLGHNSRNKVPNCSKMRTAFWRMWLRMFQAPPIIKTEPLLICAYQNDHYSALLGPSKVMNQSMIFCLWAFVYSLNIGFWGVSSNLLQKEIKVSVTRALQVFSKPNSVKWLVGMYSNTSGHSENPLQSGLAGTSQAPGAIRTAQFME